MTLGHCPSPWFGYVQRVFDIGIVRCCPGYQDSSVCIFNVADFFYSLALCRSLKQWYVSMSDKGIDVNEKKRFFFKSKVLEYSEMNLSMVLFLLYTSKLQAKALYWCKEHGPFQTPIWSFQSCWLESTVEDKNKIHQLICARPSHSDFLNLPQTCLRHQFCSSLFIFFLWKKKGGGASFVLILAYLFLFYP